MNAKLRAVPALHTDEDVAFSISLQWEEEDKLREKKLSLAKKLSKLDPDTRKKDYLSAIKPLDARREELEEELNMINSRKGELKNLFKIEEPTEVSKKVLIAMGVELPSLFEIFEECYRPSFKTASQVTRAAKDKYPHLNTSSFQSSISSKGWFRAKKFPR